MPLEAANIMTAIILLASAIWVLRPIRIWLAKPEAVVTNLEAARACSPNLLMINTVVLIINRVALYGGLVR